MASKKKLLQAAAGSAGGAGLDVDEVFSTYLYDGTGSAQTITNNIDLSGEGGLVWIKKRDGSNSHNLEDTARGAGKSINSDTTNAEDDQSGSFGISAFNSNGFSLVGAGGRTNTNNAEYASWTFRKAPKFFDIVTYTGTGTPQNISHSLNSTVGMIAVKRTDTTGNWAVYHRGANGGTDPEDYHAGFNLTDEFANNLGYWNDTAPTTTQFTVGDDSNVNANSGTYVAYLFAHNDGDGEFGPDGDADVIKCGSYTGNGSDNGPEINLGFEPQWVIIKSATSADSWWMFDNMRGMSVNYGAGVTPTTARDAAFIANGNNAEMSYNMVGPTATGFQLEASDAAVNGSGNTYIYMAIRRGPLAAPEDATKVFALDDSSTTDIGGYTLNSNFPVDFYFFRNKNGGDSISIPRLTVGDLRFNQTFVEEDRSSVMNFDSNTGVTRTTFQGGIDSVDYAFRRAPNFFDVVTYTGTGSARTVAHNLGVAPEMMWVRRRNVTNNWKTFHSSLGGTKSMELNTTVAAETNGSVLWNSTAPTASVFSLGTASDVNGSGQTFVAYLFATAAGVSKVGSYTGNGSTMTIDCGFSSGARFVLIKRTDTTDNWYVWDSARGIVSGTEPYIRLNNDSAETGSADYIDPDSSGFALPNDYFTTNGATFIFYAIA